VSSTICFLFTFVLARCPSEDSLVSLTIRFLFDFACEPWGWGEGGGRPPWGPGGRAKLDGDT